MRRLDELLTHATERGTRMGPERLIDHLERRLQGETEVVVAAPHKGATMLDTKVRPTTPTEPPPRRRTRWAYALAAFVLVSAAVAFTVTVFAGNDDEVADQVTQATAIELTQEFAANVRNGDLAALIAGATGPTNDAFLEWHFGLQSNPEFEDCRIIRENANGFIVGCDVVYHPDSFFARAVTASGPISLDVFPDATVNVASWPPPAGLSDVALELRSFFDARHPELVDTVFGTRGYAGMAWSREAGETIATHLDEFIEWRATP